MPENLTMQNMTVQVIRITLSVLSLHEYC